MNTKYIALSGAHGTGKSTMAYKIASYLKLQGKDIILLDELARECPFEINKGATFETLMWIMCAQIKRELELKGKYDYVICDRTVVDTLAYAKCTDNPVRKLAFTEYAKNTYDLILFLSHHSFNYQIPDGVRCMDQEFRIKVGECMQDIYHRYGVDYELCFDEEDVFSSIEEFV